MLPLFLFPHILYAEQPENKCSAAEKNVNNQGNKALTIHHPNPTNVQGEAEYAYHGPLPPCCR